MDRAGSAARFRPFFDRAHSFGTPIALWIECLPEAAGAGSAGSEQSDCVKGFEFTQV